MIAGFAEPFAPDTFDKNSERYLLAEYNNLTPKECVDDSAVGDDLCPSWLDCAKASLFGFCLQAN